LETVELPDGRVCSLCGEYKTREFFGMHKGKLRSQCKLCEKEYRLANKEKIKAHAKEYVARNKERRREYYKQYNEKNAEKVKASRRAYREANKEKRAAYNKDYHEKNKEQRAEYARMRYQEKKTRIRIVGSLYYKNNKEKVLAKHRKWREDNPGICRIYNYNRRAKDRSAGLHTHKYVKVLMENQQGLCALCGEDISAYYEVDHIHSIFRGGNSDTSNLQLLCKECNRSKHVKSPEEFIEHIKHVDAEKYDKIVKHQAYIETLNQPEQNQPLTEAA